MTARPQMPPARRRPIPGMASSNRPSADAPPAAAGPPRRPTSDPASARAPAPLDGAGAAGRRPALDYAATRLVNFRLPVDLHDRFKRLVREAEARYPRLRRPSLTEVLIALLEEGPADADEIAELIRRKRAAEHGAEP
jgi:hypothetical protein